jgi:aromatic ring-opening dioxygenase catalytic subunit (LigB family)
MHDRTEGLTRRQTLAAAAAGAALSALPGCRAEANGGPAPSADDDATTAPRARMPVAFVPHGGGPWPFVELGMPRAEVDALAGYLRSLAAAPPVKPTALLVVSAHWEERTPTVMTGERPPLYYDYYGFPPESYALTWPAPGAPRLAARVQELLGAAGIATASDAARGFDHGTFIPLKLTYPQAEVPTIQLSLKAGLDPADHLAIGRAIAPLRDEGVFIVGSGMSYHNLREFVRGDGRVSQLFDGWLTEAVAQEPAERDRRLERWAEAPAARRAHPREEHLLPLMVVAGAAGADRGKLAYSGTMLGHRLSAFHFG